MASVYVENGVVCIKHTPDNSPYPIEVDRCNTYPKIVKWVAALSEKPWCSCEVINDFIETACKENNLDYHTDGAA
ncbi:hypothetical protein [Desulfovibrio sp. TomC]|uniref:hypothetical protein n=1 Tax=Desulfovibrio sp. TomC TaxID=1562888 RepID=UPI0012E11FBF|nr:hypothetical protein [Desulfovibrio sp. TomC]